MEGQAQGHHVGIELVELQGRSVLREGIQVHLKEIHSEFTVNIVEFVFVPAISFFKMFLIYFFKIVEIVRAFGIHAFVDDKVFPVFFMYQSISTVGAA